MAEPRNIEPRYDDAMATRNRWVMAVGIGVLGTGLIKVASMVLLGEGSTLIHTWPFALGLVAVGSSLCWIASR